MSLKPIGYYVNNALTEITMSRIRTIKPEFFTSEDIVALSPLARLFYVSLWCEADREGRLKWQKKTLKMRYLPADECPIDELSAELERAGLVITYEADGKQYAYIPGFTYHQVINNREAESIIPQPPFLDASTTRESGVKAEGKEGRKGKEGKGREGAQKERPSSADEVTDYARSIGFNLDGQKFIDHYQANGWMRGKSKIKDWRAAVRTWKQMDNSKSNNQQSNSGLSKRPLN